MLGLPEEEQYRLLWEKYGLSEDKARALKGKGFSYYDLDKGSMYAYVAQNRWKMCWNCAGKIHG